MVVNSFEDVLLYRVKPRGRRSNKRLLIIFNKAVLKLVIGVEACRSRRGARWRGRGSIYYKQQLRPQGAGLRRFFIPPKHQGHGRRGMLKCQGERTPAWGSSPSKAFFILRGSQRYPDQHHWLDIKRTFALHYSTIHHPGESIWSVMSSRSTILLVRFV